MEIPVRWLALSLSALILLLGGGRATVQPPSSLAYTTGTAVYTVGTTIPANSPTSTGGAVTAYSVSPDLPAGLSLDDDTGIISGTPTAVTATASYTVTASNASGSTTATLTITVNAAAAGVQFIPNMNQWITPLAPRRLPVPAADHSWLVNGNPWAGGAGGLERGEYGREDAAGSDQWVQPHLSTRIAPKACAFGPEPPVVELAPGMSPADGGLPAANSPSSEYVFIYDISAGTPVYKQNVMIPNAYHGIAFDPKQAAFYVSSGMGDFPFDSKGLPANPPSDPYQSDNVHIFTLNATTPGRLRRRRWRPDPSFPSATRGALAFRVPPSDSEATLGKQRGFRAALRRRPRGFQ